MISTLRRLSRMPPRALARRFVRTGREHAHAVAFRPLDKVRRSYAARSPGPLRAIFAPAPLESLVPHAREICELAELYLEHRFDLLGSGWVHVHHGMRSAGVGGHRYDRGAAVQPDSAGRWLDDRINPANRDESRRLWRLVYPPYVPLDWHIDFKSGFRWSERAWYRDVQYGDAAGVDVKVPWELARMQHLPVVAHAYALARRQHPGFRDARVYLDEYRNEILDFLAQNPPRFGVNWACTMDVAIRLVQWLVTHDLMVGAGAELDDDFAAVLARATLEHGSHCRANLEDLREPRTNHYLADLAGVLFAGAYLGHKPWLDFAARRLGSEIEHQFHAEGSNVEASLSYHRLSTEILLYSGVLCLRIDAGALLPRSFWTRLERALDFTDAVMHEDGRVPQIGDNDSGRFLRVWPGFVERTVADVKECYDNVDDVNLGRGDASYWHDPVLDHRHLLGAGGVLFGRSDLRVRGSETPEVAWLERNIGSRAVLSSGPSAPAPLPVRAAGEPASISQWVRAMKDQHGAPRVYRFPGRSLHDRLTLRWFPSFGLAIFRSRTLHLAVRCGPEGDRFAGGHVHNDQLSIELWIDGKPVVRDPGTYVYTPLPAQRNTYRSAAAHFTPLRHGYDQRSWRPGLRGLFEATSQCIGECLHLSDEGFVGRHAGFGAPVIRIVELLDSAVVVSDFGADAVGGIGVPVSDGYGRLLRHELAYRPDETQ